MSKLTEFRIFVSNDLTRLHKVTAEVREQLARTAPELADEQLTEIAIALEEALTNAVVHGNLEVSSETRDDIRVFHGLVTERRDCLPYRDRQVVLTVAISSSSVTLKVSDDGQGFDPASIPDPLHPVNATRSYGRGLLIINSMMDEVRHNLRGNEITMIKHRASRAIQPKRTRRPSDSAIS